MLKRSAPLLLLLAAAPHFMKAQDIPTATQAGQAQVGVGYTNASTDEFPKHIGGLTVYGTFDFSQHFGVEGAVHILTLQQPDQYTQKSYEAGIRYVRHYGRFAPYGRVLAGVGAYSQTTYYTTDTYSDSFDMVSFGAGTDYRLGYKLSARADYEYQIWVDYPPNQLTPSLLTVGLAYHIR